VRVQPYRLANSRCFNGTDPRISCIACHNPHKDLIRNDASYDSKCLACHAASAPPSSTGVPAAPVVGARGGSTDKAKTCPTATANCVSCHMPKVTLPGGYLHFTDHQIRIVKAGESFPN